MYTISIRIYNNYLKDLHYNFWNSWTKTKKNRQKFWAISHGNFLRAFRISKKRLEYGRPVNLVKIRFRSGGFGGGWNFPRFHEFPGQLASPSAASTRERPGKKIRMQIPKTRKNVIRKNKNLGKNIWHQKKKSLCNMHHFSLGISLFLSLFNQKKSLAPSPSRFLLGLGIGENSCPPQKKTPKQHGGWWKKVLFWQSFCWQCFLGKTTLFCLDSHFFLNCKKKWGRKKFKHESFPEASTTSPPDQMAISALLLKTEASSIGKSNPLALQISSKPNRPGWRCDLVHVGWLVETCLENVCWKYVQNTQNSWMFNVHSSNPRNNWNLAMSVVTLHALLLASWQSSMLFLLVICCESSRLKAWLR